ncbi:phosphocholine-specific phospholipase C [Streptacidiphilus monticola]|uniref:phospholipase C n=1 Tax=Streptacidiphilus monticola TaxID=2161674 RepID=A0ABW1FXY8_9ACTN
MAPSSVNRRRFLQLSGGTAAATLLSQSIARAAALPANRRTRSIRDVEHVVILMQENRSFDHYFGTLRGVRGFGDPHPVAQPNGKPVWYQSDGAKSGAKDVLPFHPDAADLGSAFLEDLPHDWNSGHKAFNGGRYDQWVPNKSATTMAHLTRQDIPFHFALADAFTVCDAYHCSLIGPTDPNRYYLWTGWTGNDGKGGGPVISNAEAGYDWTTYPERLEQAGISWKIYQDIGTGLDANGSWGWTDDAYIGNYGDNSLLYFHQYQNAKPGDPLHDKARTGTNAAAGEGYFDRLRADVKAGTLPQVSWIVAPEAFTEHPNWPVNYGAWYIAQVLDALTSDPEVWARTALFITYDENDGFFDHVVPPFPPLNDAQGGSTVDTANELYGATASSTPAPYGLGQRVPMLVVSPWSKGGYVCSEVFDHTSVIRFLETRFGVHEPNISAWRRSVCGDLTSAFDFTHADGSVPPLPDTSGYRPKDRDRHPDYVPTPPADPRLPRQEPGTRPARPLPYDLAADLRVDRVGGRIGVAFANHGRGTGAHFLATSGALTGGPWSWTVGAGDTLDAALTIPGSAYDVTVHGPNGFLRHTAGVLGRTEVEVTARHQADGRVLVTLRNAGATTVELRVADAYRPHAVAEHHRLRPGARLRLRRGGPGWYDLTLTADADPAWRYRLAGHVETGHPSVSDPRLG